MLEKTICSKSEDERNKRAREMFSAIQKPPVRAAVPPISQKEYEDRLKKKEMFSYLGIEIDVFDGEDDEDDASELEDRARAILLINENKTIPKDLEQRLLERKEKRKAKCVEKDE